MTDVTVYLKNGLWCYQADGGEMCVPPHVYSREGVRLFFGPEYNVAFMGEDRSKVRKIKIETGDWPDYEAKAETPSKKPSGLSLRGRRNRPVAQYELNGRFMRTWESCRVAAASVGCERTTLHKCCSGATSSAYGFIWRWVVNGKYPKKVEPYTKPIGNNGRNRAVIMKDLSGKVLARYDSIMAAARACRLESRTLRRHLIEVKTPLRGKIWEFAK